VRLLNTFRKRLGYAKNNSGRSGSPLVGEKKKLILWGQGMSERVTKAEYLVLGVFWVRESIGNIAIFICAHPEGDSI
jgi:hypothetical protein